MIAEHNQELADTLNARTFALAQADRRRRADDEHLLDLPGRADRVPGAPRRQHRVPRARSTRRSRAEGLTLRARASATRTSSGCWSRRSASTSCKRARSSGRSTDLRVGPFYGCYIVRPTDRLGDRREHPRDRYLHMVIEALGGTVVDYAGAYKCCGFPIITMNKRDLAQAGRPPPRRRDRRRRRLPRHAVPAVPPQPRPAAAAAPRRSSGASSACRCCTCRSSSASRSASSRRSSGMNKHVVKPTSVIDWSTSVVAGVGGRLRGGW